MLINLRHSLNFNRYILTLSDYFSKRVEEIPIPTKEACEVSKALYKVIIRLCTHMSVMHYFVFKQIFIRMGLPEILTTDNGTKFKNQLNAEMAKRLNIKHNSITPYHPQACMHLYSIVSFLSCSRMDWMKGLIRRYVNACQSS